MKKQKKKGQAVKLQVEPEEEEEDEEKTKKKKRQVKLQVEPEEISIPVQESSEQIRKGKRRIIRTRQKWKAVHRCQLEKGPDEVGTFFPGDGVKIKIKRWMLRKLLASPQNPLTRMLLQSEAGIREERYKQLRSYPFVVHPFSRVRSMWEIGMVFVLYISIMEIPMGTAFRLNDYQYFAIFDYTMSGLCLVDCIFTFMCGYYDLYTHEVILKPSTVAKSYFLGYFWPDFLSAFPFEPIVHIFTDSEEVDGFMNLIPLVKLLRILSLLRYFKQLALEVDMDELLVIIIRFIILSTIYLQWISCGYYLVADLIQWRYIKKADERSWIIKTHLVNATNWKKYQYSLFRGLTTAFNTAVGAVVPETVEDIYFTCFVVMSGQLFLMLFLSLMYQIRSAITASKRKYLTMEQELKEFMKHNRLPVHLQSRLLQYYEFRFRKRYFREQEILETLTGQLSEEIVMFNCRQLVENVEFFKELPIDLIVRIVAHLKSEIYLTDDIIVKVGTKGDFMYFIATGTVAVLGPDNQELALLDEGSYFGEIALVMEYMRTATVVAVEMCELYRLDRVDFRAAIGPYPDLLLRVEQIARQRFRDIQQHKRRMSTVSNS